MQKYAKYMQVICKICKICIFDFHMQNMQEYALPTLLMGPSLAEARDSEPEAQGWGMDVRAL